MLNIWMFSGKAEQHLTQAHGNMRRSRHRLLSKMLIWFIIVEFTWFKPILMLKLSLCTLWFESISSPQSPKYFTGPFLSMVFKLLIVCQDNDSLRPTSLLKTYLMSGKWKQNLLTFPTVKCQLLIQFLYIWCIVLFLV